MNCVKTCLSSKPQPGGIVSTRLRHPVWRRRWWVPRGRNANRRRQHSAGSCCLKPFLKCLNWSIPAFYPFKNGPTPASFWFIFGLFKQTIQFYKNICEKCPSSKWCRDSNPRPSERESLPITTRPGLPLSGQFIFCFRICNTVDSK